MPIPNETENTGNIRFRYCISKLKKNGFVFGIRPIPNLPTIPEIPDSGFRHPSARVPPYGIQQYLRPRSESERTTTHNTSGILPIPTDTFLRYCFGICHPPCEKALTLLALQSRFGDNWGRIPWSLSCLSPKRDWSSKRVKRTQKTCTAACSLYVASKRPTTRPSIPPSRTGSGDCVVTGTRL